MKKGQQLRFVVIALAIASIQVAGFDRFQLFGIASLFLPAWLVVAISGRLPATNAAIAGFVAGLAVDLLSPSLFGRYAIALAIVGAVTSVVGSHIRSWGALRGAVGTAVVVATATVWLWGFSALVGEVLPVFSGPVLAGFVVSALVSIPFARAGGILDRVAIGGATDWEDSGARSSEWVDRRAGLYSVPLPLDDDTLEAA